MKRPSPPHRRFGFTMIETLTALMVMSALVRIGLPNYQEIRLKAEAARVAGDFNVVRQAAYDFFADNHDWPQDFVAGQVPPELTGYLPEGFSFRRGPYQLDWEHWRLPSGLPGNPEIRAIMGVSIVTGDRSLGAALEEVIGSTSPHFSLGGNYTFLLEAR